MGQALSTHEFNPSNARLDSSLPRWPTGHSPRLADYPKAITRAAVEEYSPDDLCRFAHQLCRSFNRFYRDCSIKDAENKGTRLARLSLADAVGLTLKHCLSLLSIETLERM